MQEIYDRIQTMKNRGEIIEKFIRSSGNGGQNVNKVSTCVYIKHIPTGIELKISSERTQGANRKKAYELLISRINFLVIKNKKLLIDKIEKHKRQTRTKPKSIKEKILENKKISSQRKELRKKINIHSSRENI